jgi:putative ATP-dependent endonuclease of the OLD family
MHIERIVISNFRCFGAVPCGIDLSDGLTSFVGSNGSGKTAVMLALQRLFAVTSEQRRVRRQDFHIPAIEAQPARQRAFFVEVIIAFPELGDEGADHSAVPEFFHQMAADDGGEPKCRIRLSATWTDDGSLEGAIEQKFWALRTLGEPLDGDGIELKAVDRARIQMVYVPATRDGASQVTSFLRGRLWRAINWSTTIRDTVSDAGQILNDAFAGEVAVNLVSTAVRTRWQEVHTGGTDATPKFRPLDQRFQEFIKNVSVVFHPDEAGRERNVDDLSDGQRSLFHLAMTAAALDVESKLVQDPGSAGFLGSGVPLPALTIIAVEEPENNLAPFYLSRIVRQIQSLTGGSRAQAVVSSHSASILARVDPHQVRYFRLDPNTRSAQVSSIKLPDGDEEASKFVREAVRSYPELYFARFVVLGEGASEEVVLPRLSEALGFACDRSFVAIVPLGGRHVNHLWRLLSSLEIPHVTLLDLDWGRSGGGWGRIRSTCVQLLDTGVAPAALFGDVDNLASIDVQAALKPNDVGALRTWCDRLRDFGVYFCWPLDLDHSMLRAFPEAYQVLDQGATGPSEHGDAQLAVLGSPSALLPKGTYLEADMRWYRYLFLGRGKPSTHMRALGRLNPTDLAARAPEELKAMIGVVRATVANGEPAPATRTPTGVT